MTGVQTCALPILARLGNINLDSQLLTRQFKAKNDLREIIALLQRLQGQTSHQAELNAALKNLSEFAIRLGIEVHKMETTGARLVLNQSLNEGVSFRQPGASLRLSSDLGRELSTQTSTFIQAAKQSVSVNEGLVSDSDLQRITSSQGVGTSVTATPVIIPTEGGPLFTAFIGGILQTHGVDQLVQERLPVARKVLSERPYIFTFQTQGKDVIATAEGLEVKLPVSSAERQQILKAQPRQDSTALNLSDLQALRQALVTKVGDDLSSMALPADLSQRKAVVRFNVGIYAGVSSQNRPVYEDNLVAGARMAVSKAKSRGIQAIILAVGTQALVNELLSRPGANQVFLTQVPADFSAAQNVLVTLPGNLKRGLYNLPARPVVDGDITLPELQLLLAIFAAFNDPRNPSDSFHSAYATMAGIRPDTQVLGDILEALVKAQIAWEFALRAIERANINIAMRFMQLSIRMLQQAA